jgi:hypothetical protein
MQKNTLKVETVTDKPGDCQGCRVSQLFFALLIVGVVTAASALVAQSTPAQSSGAAKTPSNSAKKPLPLPLDAQYKARFASYDAEIADLLAAKKISDDEVDSYKTKIYRLKRLEFQVRKDSFEPAAVAHLNKQITNFQKFLTELKQRPSADKTKTEDKPE